MYSRSIKGSLIALSSTFGLRKAFLNTYHEVSVDKDMGRHTIRPIRPNPLIPMLIVILEALIG